LARGVVSLWQEFAFKLSDEDKNLLPLLPIFMRRRGGVSMLDFLLDIFVCPGHSGDIVVSG